MCVKRQTMREENEMMIEKILSHFSALILCVDFLSLHRSDIVAFVANFIPVKYKSYLYLFWCSFGIYGMGNLKSVVDLNQTVTSSDGICYAILQCHSINSIHLNARRFRLRWMK